MKKLILVLAILLMTVGSAFCAKFEETKIAAEQGDAEAQFSLSERYYFGNGVRKDHQQSVYWLQKAAEQGYVMAQSYLAVRYNTGEGVDQNYEQAFYWWQQAANQGYALSQSCLADCYYHGLGVPVDYVQSYMWCQISFTLGEEFVKSATTETLRRLKSKITEDQIAQGQKLADEWLEEFKAKQQPQPE